MPVDRTGFERDQPPSASVPADGGAEFGTTQWSLVLSAGHRSSPDGHDALSLLCSRYWLPVYSYVRRRVRDVHEAQDLTQAFFARLLEKEILASARPDRGRFRAFLLTCLKRFLVNEWGKAGAQKRGGGRAAISLDFDASESGLQIEPTDDMTPERAYDRQWALTLLDRVLTTLEKEMTAAGKRTQFETLKGFLSGKRSPGAYAEAARLMHVSEGAVKVAAHRLRKRYRQLMRDEIAQTVADPNEVEEEIRSLFVSLGP